MITLANNNQRSNFIIIGIIVVVIVCGIFYISSSCNRGDLKGEISENSYELSQMNKVLKQLVIENKQLRDQQSNMKNDIEKSIKLQETNIERNVENDKRNNQNFDKNSEVRNDRKEDGSQQMNKIDQGYSGQEWEEVLSFLHMDTHGLCEDIFRADAGKTYKDKLSHHMDLIAEHNSYLKSLNLTRLFTDFDGHTANYIEETYVYWSLARLPFVKTVCETGFNAGHSTHLWLSAKPDMKVYSFDIGGFPSAKPMSAYLQKKYPDRLTITWGDSTKTLPAFRSRNPDIKCDLMVVDGGHEYDIALQDILNFQKMKRGPKNILVIDNYPDHRFGNKHARAWEQFKRRGEVFEIFQCHYEQFRSGFTFGRFIV